MTEELITYLESLSKKRESDLAWSKLEQSARERRIPIMEKTSMNFIKQLIRLYRPSRILEIGTAIGYSALQMNEARPEAKITTIERDEERFQEAEKRIQEYGLQDHITTLFGDASDILEEMVANDEQFDFIFIDAAKGQYQNFFDLGNQLLTNDGVIVTDNVLFKGYVLGHMDIPKRFKNMVQKIKSFNEYIIMHEAFTTEIIPIGDGVAISLKNQSKAD